jgi:hypothetical protein
MEWERQKMLLEEKIKKKKSKRDAELKIKEEKLQKETEEERVELLSKAESQVEQEAERKRESLMKGFEEKLSETHTEAERHRLMSQFEEDGAKLEDTLQEERDRQVMEVEREINRRKERRARMIQRDHQEKLKEDLETKQKELEQSHLSVCPSICPFNHFPPFSFPLSLTLD